MTHWVTRALECCEGAFDEFAATLGLTRHLIVPIDFEDVTGQPNDSDGNPAALPADSLVQRVTVIRTTAWDALTTFEAGVAGTSDLFVTNAQHNLTGAAPDAEEVDANIVRVAATPIIHTWDQGAATEGAGYVVYEYLVYA
jgi:hypothetical protein